MSKNVVKHHPQGLLPGEDPASKIEESTTVIQGDHCVALQVFGTPIYTPKQARKLARALKRAARYSEEADLLDPSLEARQRWMAGEVLTLLPGEPCTDSPDPGPCPSCGRDVSVASSHFDGSRFACEDPS